MARTTRTAKKVGGGAKVSDSSQTRRRSPRGSVSGTSTPPEPPPTAKRTTRSVVDRKASKARKKGAEDTPAAVLSAAAPDAAPPAADGDRQAAETANETVADDRHGGGERGGSSRAGSADAPANGEAPGVTEEEEEESRDNPAARPNARREAFAQVARARGAHFARPDKKNASSSSAAATGASAGGGRSRGRSSGAAGGGGGGGGVAASGGSEGPKELWPGPFAEARRLMDKREAAAALREEVRVNGRAAAASDDDSDEERGQTAPTIKVEWKPKGRGSRMGKSRSVPSLFRLCLDLLADKFDHVESLGDVSPEVRNHLANVLCRQLKLTTEALQRLSEPGVTELILPDCSRIEPDQMRASLLQCRSSLRVLRLGTCGRCVGDDTLKALVAAGGLPRLEMAALAGTYRVTDTGVLELLGCCPRLTGLELPANSRITRSSLEAMVDSKRPVGSALTSLSLKDCIHLVPEDLGALKDMRRLESLSLSGLTKITDGTLGQSLEVCGWKLRHLDVSDCVSITDATLRLIGELCGVLESLSLGMCPLLTNVAIEELFQYRGSSSDVACNGQHKSTVTVSAVSSSNRNDNKGKGKGKEKHTPAASAGNGKGKGKGKSTANATPPPPLQEDGDDRGENGGGFDGGKPGEEGAGEGPGRDVGEAESAGRGEEREAGHAMLKSRLAKISLRGLVQVDDGTVMAMAAACSDGLRELDLKGVALVSDNTLVALAQFCSSSLESLDLSFCRAVSDDGLGHLVDACPRLRSLRLWGCTQIGDRFLKGHSRADLAISRY